MQHFYVLVYSIMIQTASIKIEAVFSFPKAQTLQEIEYEFINFVAFIHFKRIINMTRTLPLFIAAMFLYLGTSAQHISDFISIEPGGQGTTFDFPEGTHTWQKMIINGDALTAGGTMPDNHDFAGYVPIDGSSTTGYLSINSELTPGGVTILDINHDPVTKLWDVVASEAVDFSSVGGTARNCSGHVTAWGTIISSEETNQ